jgi:catechol 2,3-dioxygenase-like lactoylglutathione lyase family enzyme
LPVNPTIRARRFRRMLDRWRASDDDRAASGGQNPFQKGRAMKVTCDHLHLRSADPDKAGEAYVALFGATVASRAETNGSLRVVVDLGGLHLFIERVPGDTRAAPPPPFVGIEHIGLRVADLDAAAAELRGKGAHFLVEPRSPRPGVKIAFVEGPDGVRIELLERAAG